MQPAERIFELVDAKFDEQQEFAAAVGVSADTASNWRRGISKSYSKYIDKIAAILGTSVDYLLTGTVPEMAGAESLSEDDAEILRQIHDRPGMRVMFSLTSKASDEDIKKATEIIRAFLGVPEGES